MRQQASAATLLLQQALAHHQQGKMKVAEELYKKVLSKAPAHFEANYLYGMLKLHLEDWEAAQQQLGKAININPAHVDTYFDRATALEHLQRFEEALQCYDRALVLKPDFLQAQHMRSNALRALGRLDDALDGYQKVLAGNPGDAEVWFEYANTQHDMGLPDEAIASYLKAIELRPDFPEALFNLGNTYRQLTQLDEAESCYRKALEIDPKFIQAISNLSHVLYQQGRAEEALAAFDESAGINGDSVELRFNRGSTLEDLQRFDDAVEQYQRAQEIDPDYAPAHWNESLLRLRLGDFANGWKKYEWRWRTDQMRDQLRRFSQPLWLGEEPIEGKTILIHAEQGFGDSIQFIRFASILAARKATVIAQVQPAIKELLHTAPGISQVLGPDDALPHFDFHCPLMSLPLACGMSSESDIPRAPYLAVDSAKWRTWYEKLGPKQGFRVGLVWAGSAASGNPGSVTIDPLRSIPFAAFTPLLTLLRKHPNLSFYSLQLGEPRRQLLDSPVRRQVIDYTDELQDFSDTAALMTNLDLLISVDTSVCHLAGAIGKPVWMLNRFNTCWRWQLERIDTPWYSNFNLFRQGQGEAWETVVARVRDSLDQVLGNGA